MNALAALRELVACADLEERAGKLSRDPNRPNDDFTDAMREYRQRNPLAWAAARAVLADHDAGGVQRVHGAGAENVAGGSPSGLNDSQRSRAVSQPAGKSGSALPQWQAMDLAAQLRSLADGGWSRKYPAKMVHAAADMLESLATNAGVAKEVDAAEPALRAALGRSVVALDDWLNIYASEMCDEARVEEARQRINERGTLSYIAHVQEQNRAALNIMAATPCTPTGLAEQSVGAGGSAATHYDAGGVERHAEQDGSRPRSGPASPTDEQLTALIAGLLFHKHTVPTTRERAEMIDDMRDAAAALTALRTRAEQAEREREKEHMLVLLYRAYNSPESEHRKAAFRDAMSRADIAESALAAAESRAKALHEALRKRAIDHPRYGPDGLGVTLARLECKQCGHSWDVRDPERHSVDCLAAPLAKLGV